MHRYEGRPGYSRGRHHRHDHLSLAGARVVLLPSQSSQHTDSTEVETVFSLVDVQRNEHQIDASWEYHAAWGNNREDMVPLAEGWVTVTLGESQGAILPTKPGDVPNLNSPDSDRFYSTMADIGYGYSGPFRALSSLRRSLGAARGHVANAQTGDHKGPYLVHPASLDAAFQSIILAFCLPDDGRLWSLHVPLRMKRMRIDPHLLPHNLQITHKWSSLSSHR
ncbi:hypothetical protein VN97_g12425 [Penicillium thymicola]|uniref:PKS/mFAS DH domain-containing protein n=1 Tax=Penicillium thymicola TaxID=293382 RepID=A0AAI9T5E2_PENTH|nr:hypothetical protein VN97_g12425 [Penicillium thymicola]